MPDPAPISTPVIPEGWKPTNSTMAGALLGGPAAQLICAALGYFIHAPISISTAGAIGTVCTFACGYIFKDGGRK